ncbi:MAG TPA: A24 family peptidase [Candidatus Eisenbacteria bacterium]|nr:A24 family peptidase [Candidatus Eisenbacteria bacterium]
MTTPIWVLVPVVLVAAGATWTDLKTRRVPNALTFPALLAGIAAHAVMQGRAGALSAALGMLVAGGLFLPGWLMGWKGAGDVKLMAAVGAWVGFPQAVIAALVSFIAGGVIALIEAVRRRMLKQSLANIGMFGAWVMSRGAGVRPMTSGERFPFALAVLVGGVTAMVWKF